MASEWLLNFNQANNAHKSPQRKRAHLPVACTVELLESRCLLSAALCADDTAPCVTTPQFAPTAPAAVVTFPDPSLEAAVRTAIHQPNGQITTADMLTLTNLPATGKVIKNLTGLETALNLQNAALDNNQITDLSPLAGLNPSFLDLSGNKIVNLAPLATLTNLQDLRLSGNLITDISPLAGLTNLQFLYLSNNQITDISAISPLTKLQGLNLDNNQIASIAPLAGLTNLTFLNLFTNHIADLSPLASLTKLNFLSSFGNQIADITPLAGLTGLQFLYLNNNQIVNIAPLANLTSLQTLDVTTNYLDFTPGSPAAGIITALQDQGTTVDSLPQNSAAPANVLCPATSDLILNRAEGILQVLQKNAPAAPPVYQRPIIFVTSLTLNCGIGDDTLTIDFSAGNPIPPAGLFYNAGGGNDIINLAAAFSLSGSLTLIGGNTTFNTDANGLSINLSDSAVVSFAASQHLAALTLANNAKANLSTAGDHFIRTSELSIAPTATLDMADNDLILQSTAANRSTDLANAAALITTGRSNGLWTGPGLTSSAAASEPNKLTGLAIALNDKGNGSLLYPAFDSETVDANSILIKYTYNGDADLSGKIDADDFFQIDDGFAGRLTTYRNGDFDFNGTVDADDYFLIDRAFVGQSATLSRAAKPAHAARHHRHRH